MEVTLQKILDDILEELEFAEGKFPGYNSSHEGLAVIWEEFEELKTEVWENKWDQIIDYEDSYLRQRKEAIQIAVTSIRFIKMCDGILNDIHRKCRGCINHVESLRCSFHAEDPRNPVPCGLYLFGKDCEGYHLKV